MPTTFEVLFRTRLDDTMAIRALPESVSRSSSTQEDRVRVPKQHDEPLQEDGPQLTLEPFLAHEGYQPSFPGR